MVYKYDGVRDAIAEWYKSTPIHHHSRIGPEELYELWEVVASIDEDYFAITPNLKDRMTNLVNWIKRKLPQEEDHRIANQPTKNMRAFLEIVSEKHGDESQEVEKTDKQEVENEPHSKKKNASTAVSMTRTKTAPTTIKSASTPTMPATTGKAQRAHYGREDAKNAVVRIILDGCKLITLDDFDLGEKTLKAAIKELQGLKIV